MTAPEAWSVLHGMYRKRCRHRICLCIEFMRWFDLIGDEVRWEMYATLREHLGYSDTEPIWPDGDWRSRAEFCWLHAKAANELT